MPKAKRRISYLSDMDTAREASVVQHQILRAMTLKEHSKATPERIATAVVAFIKDCAKRFPKSKGNLAAHIHRKYDFNEAVVIEVNYLRSFVKTWRKF